MTAEIGHNSIEKKALKSFVERCEKLIEERIDINSDIRAVLAEAKAQGYDPKTIRVVIRERAKDADKRAEERALIDAYLDALGLL